MDILGLNNLKRVAPEGTNKNQRQNGRSSSKQRPIYNLKNEAGANVYNEGLPVKLGTPLAQVERLYIKNALGRYNGDRNKTARALNLGKGTLTKKMKGYGL